MMSRGDWQALTPDLDWSKYLAAARAPSFNQINVSVPSYLKSLNALVTSTSLTDLKAYLAWQLVNGSAQMLPKAFVDADFDFYSRTLGGQEAQLPRWQRWAPLLSALARHSAKRSSPRRSDPPRKSTR
jgi:predicted metalloendopeptidase